MDYFFTGRGDGGGGGGRGMDPLAAPVSATDIWIADLLIDDDESIIFDCFSWLGQECMFCMV